MSEGQKEKTFTEQMSLFRDAGYACLYLISKEEKVAEEELLKALRKHPKTGRILRFSVASALQEITNDGKLKMVNEECTDPDEVLGTLVSILGVPGEDDDTTNVIILPDFAEYLRRDAITRRRFRERVWWCRNVGHQMIMIGTSRQEIPDIENDITVFQHGLPSKETTEELLTSMSDQYEVSINPEKIERCVESLSGMTSVAQEDAISMSIVSTGKSGLVAI